MLASARAPSRVRNAPRMFSLRHDTKAAESAMTSNPAGIAEHAAGSAGRMAAPARALVPPDFFEALFGRVPPEDLRDYSEATLADLAAHAYEHLRMRRSTGHADLRFLDVDIERKGRRREITVLEVVNDDMPFLLDSTLAEIAEQGYEPKLVAHPILAVGRDESGGLTRFLGEATGARPAQVKRES